jgi:hypothetical protein
MKNEAEAVRIVQALQTCAVEEIDREIPRFNRCIQATRVAVEVLGHFGIEAKPVPLHVAIFPPDLVAEVEGKSVEEKRQTVTAAINAGRVSGYMFGDRTKRGDGTEEWSGHLVAEVAGKVYLDLDSRQFNRTERGIVGVAETLMWPIPDWARVGDMGCIVDVNDIQMYVWLMQSEEWRPMYERADTDRIVRRIVQRLGG